MNGSESVKAELRQRVLGAVESCQYSPSVGRRTRTSIALLYPEGVWIGSPYDSACLEGMMAALQRTPYDLLVLDTHRAKSEEESISQLFARKGVCGAVVRSTSASRAWVASWSDDTTPLVLLGDHFSGPGIASVFASSESASRDAIQHLRSLGHERIAFAACDRDDGDHLDRLQAYHEVMQADGLFDPTLVCRIPPYRLDGVQLIRNLLGMPNRPTAVYIADPLVAVGALNEAQRLGVSIPDELSVIGFDDCETRGLVHPRMSAVCQDARELGRTAIEYLLSRFGNPADQRPSAAKHHAWLDLGNTTGPPPSKPSRVLPSGARV